MKVLCFGDSNTYGCDPRGIFSDRYDICWCDLLAQKTGWEVINGGSNGRALPGSEGWVHSYLTKYAPVDHMIILLGTNDILRGREPDRILRDMADLLEHIQTAWPQASVTLLSPPPVSVPEESFDAPLREVTLGYCRLAEQYGIAFWDVRPWDLPLAFDGVHLSEKGHRVLAGRICDLLRLKAEI